MLIFADRTQGASSVRFDHAQSFGSSAIDDHKLSQGRSHDEPSFKRGLVIPLLTITCEFL